MGPLNTPSGKLGSLRFTLPDGSVQELSISKPTVTIGRSSSNDLIIEETSVSRQHARLTIEQGRLVVEDLGSSNGTFVNGVRLEPHKPIQAQLNHSLRIGHIDVTLSTPQAAPSDATIVSSRASQAPPQGGGAVPPLPVKKPPSSLFSRRMLLLFGIGGGGVAIVICVGAVIALAKSGLLGGRGALKINPCDRPAMEVSMLGGQIFKTSAAQTAVPSAEAGAEPGTSVAPGEIPTTQAGAEAGQTQPILTTAFMELPFPYDGGNENFGGTDEQFRRASGRNLGEGTGRINSFYDHLYPLYPAPKDPGGPGGQEDPSSPIGKNILLYWGVNDPYISYSGHPGLDFSTYVFRQPTTPVFAVADGIIEYVGTHSASGALYIKIRHTVAGVGDFQTIYWHLHPDDFFNAMLGTEGQPVTAGKRIGTMGNTGFSTGHHLHFEVRFDHDRNGEFPQGEAVDPYSWLGSGQYSEDPWFLKTGVISNYLWKHALGSVVNIPADGGGNVAQPGGTGGAFPSQQLCVEPGSLPPGGTVSYSWAPDPDPQGKAIGTGNGCNLFVKDANGNPVTQFDKPIRITIPFTEQDIQNVDPNSLKIYWKEAGSNTWTPLKTTVDLTNRVAAAETDRPGQCSLMGDTTKDVIPPKTQMIISADKATDGSMYDTATITLTSDDPSGVRETYYSTDGGTTWQLYSGPVQIEPSGIPSRAEMSAQSFGGLPGTFLVLAYSVDKAGNIEDPPIYDYFSIDPSKNPNITGTPTLSPTPTNTSTSTSTATSTSTSTPSPTVTLTNTPEGCEPVLTLTKNANCRYGPGTVYGIYTSYLTGQEFTIDGYNEDSGSKWWYVRIPKEKGHCWLADGAGTIDGNTACLSRIIAPPTPAPPTSTYTPLPPTITPTPLPPTNTPTPAPDTSPPGAPILVAPKDGSTVDCDTAKTLTWLAVSDPSGILYYEWYVADTYTGAVVLSGTAKGTSVDVIDMACFTTFAWTVRAVDGARNVGPYATPFTFYNDSALK